MEGIYIPDIEFPPYPWSGMLVVVLEEDGTAHFTKAETLEHKTVKYTTVTDADAPPTLWTDMPISGTEFMTHKQGQGGFEIHFRTDDLSKYESVQNECRRQIDHGKPAADVRLVVFCKDCLHEDCAMYHSPNWFCADGEKREES